ncbi:hypothetical protein BDR04DRAFT_1121502 [Suillus decipiens]|nr:hypothetical protein BDR04DRAFT_1121502 [Suillus decipiens]
MDNNELSIPNDYFHLKNMHEDNDRSRGWCEDDGGGVDFNEGHSTGDLTNEEEISLTGNFIDWFPRFSQSYATGHTFLDLFNSDENSVHCAKNLYYPFSGQKDWELGSWLLHLGLSMGKINSLYWHDPLDYFTPCKSALPRGATLLDIILLSDKTNVSMMMDSRVAHTLLISLTNIPMSTRLKIPPDTLHMQLQLQEVQIMMLQLDDILRCHHKKNGQPCLPDPEILELLHQVKSDKDQPTQCFSCQFTIVFLVAWDQDGKQFEAGIWPQQKSNMAWLKSATSLAPQSYLLIPPPSVPIQECAEWVEHAAADLLEGRLDIFHNQLPMSCLALYNCILNGLVKNSHRKYYPKFTAREYGPIYSKMVQMLKDILQDLYHGPRTTSLRVDRAVGFQHDHLQITLD